MTALRSSFLPVLVILSLCLGFEGAAQACAFCGSKSYKITNVDHWASLRAKPSTKAQRLAKVPLDAEVVGTGGLQESPTHEWIQVFYNGQTGWIPMRYLAFSGIIGEPDSGQTKQKVGAIAKKPTGVANASSCGGIVRARPDTDSRKLASLRQGKRVEIFDRTGIWMNGFEWYRIAFGKRRGYQWGGILSADDKRAGSYVGC